MAKGPDAFRTISEAAEEVGVPQHVLRFWETKFNFIKPMKRAGGRRFYRPTDLQVLKGVRALLHEQGYTIKGVQKLHREQGIASLARAAHPRAGGMGHADSSDETPSPDHATFAPLPMRPTLAAVLADLEAAKARLDAVLTAS